MRQLFLFLLFIFSCNHIISASPDTLFVSRITHSVNLYKYAELYEDSSNQKTIRDIIRSEPGQFKKLSTNNINIGFNDKTYWVKLNLKNTGKSAITYFLIIDYPAINYIDFFDIVHGKIIKTLKTGELRGASSREYKSLDYVFSIELLPGECHTVYVKTYCNGDSYFIPLKLESNKFFINNIILKLFINCFFLSFFVFMMIFTLFYYISTKDSIFKYYTLYLACLTIVGLYLQGIMHYIINNEWLLDRLVFFGSAYGSIFILNFTRDFLGIKKHFPLFSKIITISSWLFILVSILLYFNYPVFVYGAISLSYTIINLAILLIVSSVLMYVKVRNPLFLYLFLSHIILGTGIILHFLKDLGDIPANIVTSNVMLFSFVLETFTIFFAIMINIRNKQVEAQQKLEKKNETITQQKDELERAQIELEKLSFVIGKVDAGVGIYNEKGELTWINNGFENIHGITSEQVRSKPYYISSFYDNIVIDSVINDKITSREPLIFETDAWNNNRKISTIIQTTLTQIFNSFTQTRLFVTIDIDINKLKKIQKELAISRDKAQEANRLKSAFIANISHELRTPLNAIIGFSQLMLMRDISKEKQVNFLKMINQNGSHLLDLICDIIDVSKLEAGQLEPNPVSFNLGDVLKEIETQLVEQLSNDPTKKIKAIVELQVPPEHLNMKTDLIKLKQILLNLLSNARKFTNEGYIKITVSINKKEGEMLQFSVEDSGIGLTKEETEIVFLRFRQVDDSIARRYGGAGLGLTISKGLVTLLGGDIWIESEKNKFTRVTFTLPYQESGDKIKIKPEESAQLSSLLENKTILVVEDDVDNFSVINEILRDEKIKIIHSTTGIEAIDIFEANRSIDLVLLDIKLPDINGFDVAQVLIRKRPGTPIIALTAISVSDISNKCIKAGCIDLLSKPVTPLNLINMVHKYLTIKDNKR